MPWQSGSVICAHSAVQHVRLCSLASGRRASGLTSGLRVPIVRLLVTGKIGTKIKHAMREVCIACVNVNRRTQQPLWLHSHTISHVRIHALTACAALATASIALMPAETSLKADDTCSCKSESHQCRVSNLTRQRRATPLLITKRRLSTVVTAPTRCELALQR